MRQAERLTRDVIASWALPLSSSVLLSRSGSCLFSCPSSLANVVNPAPCPLDYTRGRHKTLQIHPFCLRSYASQRSRYASVLRHDVLLVDRRTLSAIADSRLDATNSRNSQSSALWFDRASLGTNHPFNGALNEETATAITSLRNNFTQKKRLRSWRGRVIGCERTGRRI